MNNIHRRIHPVESKKRKEFQSVASKPAPSASSQQLLAGYMAYEFLTRGTLLGQELSPDNRTETVAVTQRPNSEEVAMRAGGDQQLLKKKKTSYAEVASLLKTDGVHLSWIVNPTQLARWVQM